MKNKPQRDIFVDSEGDSWFLRNFSALSKNLDFEKDLIVSTLLKFRNVSKSSKPRLLEVGCGGGFRLEWIKNHLNFEVCGIEPSIKGVENARQLGVEANVGTAEQLAFPDKSFDFLVFGFCLYLCDRDDLFLIAAEADRVLKDDSLLIIFDFFSPIPRSVPYQHKEGIFSYKMDYRKLWNWNPNYLCISHEIISHQSESYSDKADEWVAISVMKKINHEE